MNSKQQEPWFVYQALVTEVSANSIDFKKALAKQLRIPTESIAEVKILRQSLDTRKANFPKYVWQLALQINSAQIQKSVAAKLPPWKPELNHQEPIHEFQGPVAIVGSGPAGLFCALQLARQGHEVHVYDQGGGIKDRALKIRRFVKKQEFYPYSNVLSGLGGAGAWSDGKLTSRTRNLYTQEALQLLVESGAPENIKYFAKPHIGTDKLQFIIDDLKLKAEEAGCHFFFHHRVSKLKLSEGQIQGIYVSEVHEPTDLVGYRLSEPVYRPYHQIVLATGHSSRDLIRELLLSGVALERKPFALGFRAEHPQEIINQRQHGEKVSREILGPAEYVLTMNQNNHQVYSFCMCPGGVVVPCADEEESICTNGMSYQARNAYFANSALVVPVDDDEVLPEYSNPSWDPHKILAGIEYQKKIEKKAYQMGGGGFSFPIQKLSDFVKNQAGSLPTKTSFQGKVQSVNFAGLFSEKIYQSLVEGIYDFNRKIPGFLESGQGLAPETRTSSPVRIVRNTETLESVNCIGLFPLGEGAGYSGGIISSAADGLRLAHLVKAKKK